MSQQKFARAHGALAAIEERMLRRPRRRSLAATARKFETELPVRAQTSLEATVNHIQEDVTGLKADVKRLDTKIDAVADSLVELRLETGKSFGSPGDEMTNSFATFRADMMDSIAAFRAETKDSIAAFRVEMKDSFAKLHSSQRSQLAWEICTLIAAVGACITIVRFFATP